MDAERAKVDLLRVKVALDKFNVPLILSHGVCLGVIRENRFLPWDSDIDLFILSSAPYENVVKAIKFVNDSGFEFWETYRTPKGKIIHWSFAPTLGNIAVCIKMLHPSRDPKFFLETGIALGQRRPTITLLPSRFFNPPKEIKFLNHKFLVPNPPEEYLTGCYGSNWRVPTRRTDIWREGRKWKIYLAAACKESLWSHIIRENAPARIRYLRKLGRSLEE